MSDLEKTRKIQLKNGVELTIDYSEKFEEVVRKYYNLDRSPTDEEIGFYVVKATMNALDKEKDKKSV